MEKVGGVLGWITAAFFCVAISNYFIKLIYRKHIVKLPNDNRYRQGFQVIMRLIVKYHRYFGMAAGLSAVIHLYWQLTNVHISYSGIAAALAMAAIAAIGTAVAYGCKSSLIKIHRPAALAVLAVVIFHMVTKI